MGPAAVGPRHLLQRELAELHAAVIAAPEAIVAGVEQLAAALDLIQREAQLLLGPHPRLAHDPERAEPRLDPLAGEHLGEQRREDAAAIEQPAAQLEPQRI